MIEEWKDFIYGKTVYKISNKGKVLNKYDKALGIRISKGGYLRTTLCDNYKTKQYLIHRLVAICFINNPENKETVNHIDGNKQNNHVNNLEWATRSEQLIHAYKLELRERTSWNKGKTWTKSQRELLSISRKERTEYPKEYNHAQSLSINQYDLNDNFIKEWGSIRSAAKSLNIHKQNIIACLKGRIKTAGKYRWFYKENPCTIITIL